MKYLRIFLWLLALHSLTVAMFLIFLNEEGIRYFGFTGGNLFFQVQGGVFHIVMCVAYILAATDPGSARKLIIFIVTAKTIALVYLLMYYFFIDHIMMVLLSGLGDGMMALIIFLLWKKYNAEVRHG